jgi:heme oxygenase (biliverdin-producing, ferredoxin)
MALRDHIKDNHATAEKHPFVKLLFSGGVSPRIYADYLLNQYLMYLKLETLLEQHGLLQGVESVKRSKLMLEDFHELRSNARIYDVTYEYVRYLETVSKENLMAHMYVRHFGDLFGGQLMKKVVPGSGAMYEFENRSQLIAELRSRLDDNLAEEANKVMLFAIQLFEDIANEHDIRDT